MLCSVYLIEAWDTKCCNHWVVCLNLILSNEPYSSYLCLISSASNSSLSVKIILCHCVLKLFYFYLPFCDSMCAGMPNNRLTLTLTWKQWNNLKKIKDCLPSTSIGFFLVRLQFSIEDWKCFVVDDRRDKELVEPNADMLYSICWNYCKYLSKSFDLFQLEWFHNTDDTSGRSSEITNTMQLWNIR